MIVSVHNIPEHLVNAVYLIVANECGKLDKTIKVIRQPELVGSKKEVVCR